MVGPGWSHLEVGAWSSVPRVKVWRVKEWAAVVVFMVVVVVVTGVVLVSVEA